MTDTGMFKSLKLQFMETSGEPKTDRSKSEIACAKSTETLSEEVTTPRTSSSKTKPCSQLPHGLVDMIEKHSAINEMNKDI